MIKIDPFFAEAYNRRATVHFGLKCADDCFADIERVCIRSVCGVCVYDVCVRVCMSVTMCVSVTVCVRLSVCPLLNHYHRSIAY